MREERKNSEGPAEKKGKKKCPTRHTDLVLRKGEKKIIPQKKKRAGPLEVKKKKGFRFITDT